MFCRNGHKAWEVLRRYHYAHRGFHGEGRTENSMAAFRAAVEHGFGAELDVHLMKDGNLAVIHDSSLKRTADADVCIEDLTKEELAAYALHNGEHIPLLEEVLELFKGKTPLIVELKAEKGNHDALAAAVAKRLDAYEGDFCIESFDPRVVRWFKKNRPQVCRGQLAENFFRDKNSKLPRITKFLLTNLLLSGLSRPDFVAYCFSHRDAVSPKVQMVYWTLRTQQELDQTVKEGALGIFEGFLPKE